MAGRFEVLHLQHWSALEMHQAFGWSVEQSIFHGGYLGAAGLIGDHERWVRYVRDALIETVRSRGSSPKLQVLDTALLSALAAYTFEEAQADRDYWGRLVESAVGAHLANAAASGQCELFYWRERNQEVDFVVRIGHKVTAIEVKSGRSASALPGMQAFNAAFKPDRMLLVGGNGIPLEEFLFTPVTQWMATSRVRAQ